MLEVRGLTFSYPVDGGKVDVLKKLDFLIKKGEFVGIQGPSGSGKSTLFYILGFLLKPTEGEVLFDGIDITQMSGDELTTTRNRQIGFIFQQFHLLSNTNCLNNILLPTLYPSEMPRVDPQKGERALALAERLGLARHLNHFPNQLSGGQQQRVAIARALIHDVELILADEPTGNLDSKTAAEIMELLCELNRQGKTIILITHDREVSKYCSRVFHLKDGAFTHIEEDRQGKSKSSNSGVPPLIVDKKSGFGLETAETPKRLSRGFHQGQKFGLKVSLKFTMIRSILPLVVENLFRNRVKSFLTMLGVVIGIAAVLAMITLGQFAKSKILETYEALGVNKLLLRGYPNWNLKATDKVSVNFKAFDWERDMLPLMEIFPEVTMMSPVFRMGQNNATSGGVSISNTVESYGVNSEYMAITNRSLIAGTNISPFHVEMRSPVCVIGYGVAERLFALTNALGQMITVTDRWRLTYPCRVIGVLASQTSAKDSHSPNLHILIPYTYFQTIAPDWWSAQAHEAALQIESGSDVEVAGKKIQAFFVEKYGKSGNFNADSDSALVAQMKKFLNIFAILLTAIAFLSLLVGGIGINNMILVSVTERIREFGIRKALGATNRSIRIQVLLESMGICSIAGVIGVTLGFCSYEFLIFGATKLVPGLKFEWVVLPSAVLLSFLSIVGVGVLSGLVPAIRAERLEIIEALRSE